MAPIWKLAAYSHEGPEIMLDPSELTGALLDRVYNVITYGAKGDGTTDDSAAIQSAFAAASAAGGGTVFLPKGTYLVSKQDVTGACLLPTSNTIMVGESRDGVIIKLAAAQPASTRPIIVKDATNVTIRNLTVFGNKAAQAVDEHRAAIMLWHSQRVTLEDLTLHDNSGDGVHIYGTDNTPGVATSDTLMSRCYCYANDRKAVSITGGWMQRMGFRDCIFDVNLGGQFHIETDAAPVFDTVIERCFFGKTTNNDVIGLSIGGGGDGIPSQRTTVRDCQIICPVQVIYAENVRLIGCFITTDNASALNPLLVNFDVNDLLVAGCDIGGSTVVDGVIYLQGAHASASNRPRNIRIVDNHITSQVTIQHVIRLVNAIDVLVAGNMIEATVANHARAAVAVSANDAGFPLPTTDCIIVENNRIKGTKVGVLVGGTAALTVQQVIISGNHIDANGNGVATSAWDLDDDGNHVLQNAAVFGNELTGYSAFVYPTCPILVAGSRGGGGEYIVTGSPEGVLTEIVGAIAHQRDGSGGTTTYVKESGTGNTGWRSRTSTTWLQLAPLAAASEAAGHGLDKNNLGGHAAGPALVATRAGITIIGAQFYIATGVSLTGKTVRITLWSSSGARLKQVDFVVPADGAVYSVAFPSAYTLAAYETVILSIVDTTGGGVGAFWLLTNADVTATIYGALPNTNPQSTGGLNRAVISDGLWRDDTYFAVGDAFPGGGTRIIDGSEIAVIDPVLA